MNRYYTRTADRGLKIEVGGRYRTRAGRVIEIESEWVVGYTDGLTGKRGELPMWRDAAGMSWTDEGRYGFAGPLFQHENDLVERLTP